MRKILGIIGMLFLGLSLIVTASAKVEKPRDFYRGKTIEYATGGTVGGIYDIMARLLAPRLKEHTGASAVMLVPKRGGGGVAVTNYVWRAKPSGLVIGVYQLMAIFLQDALDVKGRQFEIDKLSYIIGLGVEPHVFMVKLDGPYQSVGDLKAAKDIKLGGDRATGNYTLGSLVVASALQLDGKVIAGFGGGGKMVLAITRGEVAGSAMTMSFALRAADKLKPLFVIGSNRNKAIPDVPALTELVKLDQKNRQIVEMFGSLYGSKALYTTPGVPSDRLKYLRSIHEKIVKEPDTWAQIEKSLLKYKGGIIFSGDEMTKSAETVKKQSTRFQEAFDELFKKYRKML